MPIQTEKYLSNTSKRLNNFWVCLCKFKTYYIETTG